MRINELSVTELNNPNGQWSYGYSDPPSTLVSLFDSATHTNLPFSGTLQGYNPDVSANNNVVLVNVTGAPVPNVNGGTVAVDQIVLHPGSAGRQSVVRWTAPANGRYVGQYGWVEIDPAGDGGTGEFRVNGVSAANFTWNAAGNAGSTFDLVLNQGATLDFVLGMRGNYFSDTMGFDASISAVPLPAAAWFLLPALSVLGLRRQTLR